MRDFGFSKDGKSQHVQIMLAVIVTKGGLLVDYEEFPGNCYERHTLLPVIDKIRKRYNIDKVVILADSALMSKINLQTLETKGNLYGFYALAYLTKYPKSRIMCAWLDEHEKRAQIALGSDFS